MRLPTPKKSYLLGRYGIRTLNYRKHHRHHGQRLFPSQKCYSYSRKEQKRAQGIQEGLELRLDWSLVRIPNRVLCRAHD